MCFDFLVDVLHDLIEPPALRFVGSGIVIIDHIKLDVFVGGFVNVDWFERVLDVIQHAFIRVHIQPDLSVHLHRSAADHLFEHFPIAFGVILHFQVHFVFVVGGVVHIVEVA